MKIYVDNQTLEYINDKCNIDEILNEIDSRISKSSKILSSMIIDGVELFSDYIDYFLDNIDSIEKVEVILLTYIELVNEILRSTLNYLKRTPELIENLANSFYKSPDRNSWSDLNDLLEGIGWLISTFSSIDNDRNLNDIVSNHESWNIYSKEVISLSKILPDFEDALSNQDTVTIADLLSYEIQPKFNSMTEKLSELLSSEGNMNDLN